MTRWLNNGRKVEVIGKRGQAATDDGVAVGSLGIVIGKVRTEVETYRVRLLDGAEHKIPEKNLCWVDHFPHEVGL